MTFSSILSSFPYPYYPTDKSNYRDTKVIFLTRDIRDILVSSYFQATKRTGQFNRHISDFIRDDRYGVKKIVTFYKSWFDHQQVPEAFMHLTYEAVHHDPSGSLKSVLQFIDFPKIDEQVIETAVSFATFDNMRKMEQQGIFNNERLKPGNDNDQESFKVRRGVVGGYRDYLSTADLAYFQRTVNEMGCPFLEQYM